MESSREQLGSLPPTASLPLLVVAMLCVLILVDPVPAATAGNGFTGNLLAPPAKETHMTEIEVEASSAAADMLHRLSIETRPSDVPGFLLADVTGEVERALREGNVMYTVRRRFVLAQGTGLALNALNYDYVSGNNPNDIPIYDYFWSWSHITMAGIPPANYIARVDIRFVIRHTYVGDLYVDVSDPAFSHYEVLWNRQGGGQRDLDLWRTGINRWNGLSGNGTWTLWVGDFAGADVGYIDFWEIRVYYGTVNTPTPSPTCPAQFSSPYVARVNAGGPSVGDSQGAEWLSDAVYRYCSYPYWGATAGDLYQNAQPIEYTDDDVLYQSQRYFAGNAGYIFDVPNGMFEVTLRFAEIYPSTQRGERVFDVQAEGQTVIAGLDVMQETGWRYRALDLTFHVVVTDTRLNIDFIRQRDKGGPFVSAIKVQEIFGNTPTRTSTRTRTVTPTQPQSPPTRTPTPSITRTPTITLTPTRAFTASATPTVSQTPTPTAPPTASVTVTATGTATTTHTPTRTYTASATPTVSQTPTRTDTPTASSTATRTGTATSTNTRTQTYTASPTRTSTPCYDAYEPDDAMGQARPIAVNGAPQMHSFHASGDADFVKFGVQAGVEYVMQTLNLSPGNDTVLELMAGDGTMLASNDESGVGEPGASQIVYTFGSPATYFLRVRPFDLSTHAGCGVTYELAVTAASLSTPTPSRTPTASSTTTPSTRVTYLPVILGAYERSMVDNGGFETGTLAGWGSGGIHGCTASDAVAHAGRYAVLLGNPAYPCREGVPVGEAWISQTLAVPVSESASLSLWYRVFSEDDDRFDFLRVFVGDAGSGVLREAARMGRPQGPGYGCGVTPWDSGWQPLVINLTDPIDYRGRGVEVRIELATTNRDGWYNTWAYVDDVEVR